MSFIKTKQINKIKNNLRNRHCFRLAKETITESGALLVGVGGVFEPADDIKYPR